MLAGDRAPRELHWTRSGDLVVVSERSLWRLPRGAFGPDARLVDVDPRTAMSVYDTSQPTDRFLIGGEGFVSLRDPSSLAELKRFPLSGQVRSIVVAKSAPVAAVVACTTECNLHRVNLDGGATVELGPIMLEQVALSANGTYLSALRGDGLVVFGGATPTPQLQVPYEEASRGQVWRDDDTLLLAGYSSLSRWRPGDPKLTRLPLSGGPDSSWDVRTDARHGAMVLSQGYSKTIFVYDGVTNKRVEGPAPGCYNAKLAAEDANTIECERPLGRVLADGTFQAGRGGTVALGDKTRIRIWSDGCELVENGSDKILGASRDLCGARYSTDGSQLAWIDGGGAVHVERAESFSSPLEPRSAGDQALGSAGDGVMFGQFRDSLAMFDDGGLRVTPLPLDVRRHNELLLTRAGAFLNYYDRLVGIDYTGKPRVRVPTATERTRLSFASGEAVLTHAARTPTVTMCRFDAGCTDIDIAPADTVAGYEAPWIVTTTLEDPDAPAQSVVYLRHEDGKEPPRRIITGRLCDPALLFDGGERLGCVNDKKLLLFDSKSGAPLGEPYPLPIPAPSLPRAVGIGRQMPFPAGAVTGHGARSVFVRSAGWFPDTLQFVELAVPMPNEDAGAATAEPLSTQILGADFAAWVGREGAVRIGGVAARAERVLACRDGDRLLPFSSCQRR